MPVELLNQRREKRERDSSLESRVSALENYMAMLVRTGDVDPNIAFPGTVTIGGRLCSTVASAINAVGELTASNFNTSTKTILGDFTFGASGAIKMITDASNGLWLSPTGILCKKAGATTFSLDASGNANFAGTLVGASGTFGTITAGAISGVTISGTTITGSSLQSVNDGGYVKILRSAVILFDSNDVQVGTITKGAAANTLQIGNAGGETYIVGSTVYLQQNFRVPSYLYLGSSNTKYIKYESTGFQINHHIHPDTDGNYNIGTVSKRFYGGYFSGRMRIPVGTNLY